MGIEKIFWILVVYPAIFVALWLIKKSSAEGKLRPLAGSLLRSGFFILPTVVLLIRGASPQALGLTGGLLAPVAKWVLVAVFIAYGALMVGLGMRKSHSGEIKVMSIGVLAGAVSEEAFFRGILQTYLMALAPVWQAVVISAFLQILLHPANPIIPGGMKSGSGRRLHILTGFLLECACGVLLYRAGSLLPAILLNMFYHYNLMLRLMRFQRQSAIAG
ncbi:MAG: lysostaphin resistance A-like protein [Syntrophothermus sp.]